MIPGVHSVVGGTALTAPHFPWENQAFRCVEFRLMTSLYLRLKILVIYSVDNDAMVCSSPCMKPAFLLKDSVIRLIESEPNARFLQCVEG